MYESRQPSRDLISCVLRQLLEQQRELDREQVAFDHTALHIPTSLHDRTELLQSAVKVFDKVFLIVDALDEFSEADGEREELVDTLLQLQFNANNLKLFSSSRPAPFLESKFSLPERL